MHVCIARSTIGLLYVYLFGLLSNNLLRNEMMIMMMTMMMMMMGVCLQGMRGLTGIQVNYCCCIFRIVVDYTYTWCKHVKKILRFH